MVLLPERAGSGLLHHLATDVDPHLTRQKIHRCGTRHAVVWSGVCADVRLGTLAVHLHGTTANSVFLPGGGHGGAHACRWRLGRSPESRLHRRLRGCGG